MNILILPINDRRNNGDYNKRIIEENFVKMIQLREEIIDLF